MELPLRSKGDELLPEGALLALRSRLRTLSARFPDLTTVIGYAFDLRTRTLPYRVVDKITVPAGPRELAANLIDAGFARTRIVLGQWNPNFAPSEMSLDGRIPDLFLVSGLSVHSAHMDRLLEDVRRIPAERRPLVLAGGAHVIYEPWRVFSGNASLPWGADVACTGETHVFLHLLEALLESCGADESMRATFLRMRDHGELEGIPGLVYARGEVDGVAEELVDTGVPRLLECFDEYPLATVGYGVVHPPSRKRTITDKVVSTWRMRWIAGLATIQLTQGCKFRCGYCPIPAYNQHRDRYRTAERVVEDMRALYDTYRFTYLFGSDDNFFNRPERSLEIFEHMARAKGSNGKLLGHVMHWASEATVHDTYEVREHLPLARKAGFSAVWLGIEDMTASLIKKGQSTSKTREVMRALRASDIHAMPMLIHDDTQPLLTFRSSRGLINQVQRLRHWGAPTMQVNSLHPSPGTKLYKESYQSGMAFETAAGRPVEPRHHDGHHVVTTFAKRPWQRQLNLLLAYGYFYNPLRFLWAMVLPKVRLGYLKDPIYQAMGMYMLMWSWLRIPRWMYALWRGPIVRSTTEPRSAIPMRSVDGGEAAHDLPPGPDPKKVRRLETAPRPVPQGG